MSRVHSVLRILNLTAFCILVGFLALLLVWPEHLAALRISPDEGRIVILQLVSFLLLLGGFQVNLHAFWRRLSLAGAFLVLGEATLIGLLIPLNS